MQNFMENSKGNMVASDVKYRLSLQQLIHLGLEKNGFPHTLLLPLRRLPLFTGNRYIMLDTDVIRSYYKTGMLRIQQ